MSTTLSNPFSLENKTVLVTGAGSGLGKHFSLTLAKAGAFVILSGRKQENLVQVAKEIENGGGKCGYYCMDITHFDDIQKHIDCLFTQFSKIDILVNNAGVTSKIKKEPFQYTNLEWDEIFNTNVKSMWVLSNSIAKKMIDLKIHGSIINISSTNAARPRPTNTLYCISKGSVINLTTNLAMDYAKYNIRVNAIAPGVFGVGMSQNALQNSTLQDLVQNKLPLKRMGNLSELDGPLLLLASEASSYMTGNCLYVDGGFIIGAMV